jgi:membrane-associated protease RseP (regulator of RpoE activity)
VRAGLWKKIMRDENGEAGMRAEHTHIVNCPSCGATLVAGLRFCRMCGYRLGEGVEEYVQTQRLDPASPPVVGPPSATDPFAARTTWGATPTPPFQRLGTTTLKQSHDASGPFSWTKVCQPKRGHWWLWMIVVMVLLFGAGILPLTIKWKNQGGDNGKGGDGPPPISLIVEADGYDTADGGGAMIRGLAGPETSLERAGLLGGDIITSFDGKPVRDGDAMRKLITTTLPGKAVEVVYIRDGETKKTVLTTVIGEGFRRMEPINQRPGGRGVLNIDFDDGDRVRVPNSNIYGVELSGVERNGPADLAGLKKGDIIVELDGKPIRTAGDLRYRAGAATPGGIVNVVVVRDGQQVTIPVKMGRQK